MTEVPEHLRRRVIEAQRGWPVADRVRGPMEIRDRPPKDRYAELIEALEKLTPKPGADGKPDWGDPETAHLLADRLLLRFIADPRVTDAFNRIVKWYA
jgi:hypothetical protein